MSFASAYLAKFGWTPGLGLGKSNQGISSHVRGVQKLDQKGLGCKEDFTKSFSQIFENSAKNFNIQIDVDIDEQENEAEKEQEKLVQMDDETEEDKLKEEKEKRRERKKKRKESERNSEQKSEDVADDSSADHQSEKKTKKRHSKNIDCAAESAAAVCEPESVDIDKQKKKKKKRKEDSDGQNDEQVCLPDTNQENDMRHEHSREAKQFVPVQSNMAKVIGTPFPNFVSASNARETQSSSSHATVLYASQEAALSHAPTAVLLKQGVGAVNGKSHLYWGRVSGKLKRIAEQEEQLAKASSCSHTHSPTPTATPAPSRPQSQSPTPALTSSSSTSTSSGSVSLLALSAKSHSLADAFRPAQPQAAKDTSATLELAIESETREERKRRKKEKKENSKQSLVQ